MALVSLSLFEYMTGINFIASISLCCLYLRTWLQIMKIGYFIASISLCRLYLRTWLQIMKIDWIFHCLLFLMSSLFEDMTTDYEDWTIGFGNTSRLMVWSKGVCFSERKTMTVAGIVIISLKFDMTCFMMDKDS